MKKKQRFFSFLTTLAKSASSFLFVKKKKKTKKQEKLTKTCGYEFAVYTFEDFEDMQEAIESEQFNISTYYEMNGKPYMVVLADGTEDNLENYGGERVFEETYSDIFSIAKVETMYFGFAKEQYLIEFWNQFSKNYSKNIKLPTILYNNIIYVDLGVFDKSFHNRVIGIALEYMGSQVTDIYMAQILEEYFSKVS